MVKRQKKINDEKRGVPAVINKNRAEHVTSRGAMEVNSGLISSIASLAAVDRKKFFFSSLSSSATREKIRRKVHLTMANRAIVSLSLPILIIAVHGGLVGPRWTYQNKDQRCRYPHSLVVGVAHTVTGTDLSRTHLSVLTIAIHPIPSWTNRTGGLVVLVLLYQDKKEMSEKSQ